MVTETTDPNPAPSEAARTAAESSAEAMQEFAAQAEALAAAQRDPTVLAGTLLSETDLAGVPAKQFKNRSMVRLRGIPLPERTGVFDRQNLTRMIPTSQLPNMLSKVHATLGGMAFSLRRFSNVQEAIPIAGTCDICNVSRPSDAPKKFFSENDRRMHLMRFHTDEHANMERDEERAERKADREVQKALATQILAAVTQMPNLQKDPKPAKPAKPAA